MAKSSTILTVAEVAQLAGVCKQTVRRKIDSGALEAKRVQGAYAITEDAVRAWLQNEGYSSDRIDSLLRRGFIARADSRQEIASKMAYMLGQNFAFVVMQGLNAIRNSTAPGTACTYFGQLLDCHPESWPAELQQTFWAGFSAPTGGPVPPMIKSSQGAYEAFLDVMVSMMEDPESTRTCLVQALAKVDGNGGTEHGEQS